MVTFHRDTQIYQTSSDTLSDVVVTRHAQSQLPYFFIHTHAVFYEDIYKPTLLI